MSTLPDFDFGFGETVQQLRDSVAHFCAKELAPRAAQIDKDNAVSYTHLTLPTSDLV